MKLKVIAPDFNEEWKRIRGFYSIQIKTELDEFVEKQKITRKTQHRDFIILAICSFLMLISIIGAFYCNINWFKSGYGLIAWLNLGIGIIFLSDLATSSVVKQEELDRLLNSITRMLEQIQLCDRYEEFDIGNLEKLSEIAEASGISGISSLIYSVKRLYTMNGLLESNIVKYDYYKSENLVDLQITMADITGAIEVKSYKGYFKENINIESDQLELIEGEYIFTHKYVTGAECVTEK